jgi:hypothetical protein
MQVRLLLPQRKKATADTVTLSLFNVIHHKGMKLNFIARSVTAGAGSPALTLRLAGNCSFNKLAQAQLEMEAGEAATLAFDEDSKKWVLVYFPDGNAQHCQLRGSKHGICFSHAAACHQLFKSLPKELAGSQSVRVTLDAQKAIADDSAPGALLFLLDASEMVRCDKPAAKKGGARG